MLLANNGTMQGFELDFKLDFVVALGLGTPLCLLL